MGLKFDKTDELDKLFENFVIEPEKKATKEDVDRFLKPNKEKEPKKDTKK